MGIFDKLKKHIHDAEHSARNAAKKAGQAIKHTGEQAGHGIQHAGEQAGHSIEHTGEQAGHAVEDAGKDVLNFGKDVLNQFLNDLDKAKQLFEILAHVDFSKPGQVQPGDPAKVKSGLQAAQSHTRHTSKLAHTETASPVFHEAAKLTGTVDKVQAAGQAAKSHNLVLAIGVAAGGGVGVGASGGTGFWFEPNGTWGGYWSGNFNFGLPLGASTELVFTYISGKYGLQHFQGPSRALTLSGGEFFVGSVSLLLAEDDIKSAMGFSLGAGVGVGSPVELYTSISGTLAQAR